MHLTNLYDYGQPTLPSTGRYKVEMKVGGQWQTVLEKRIHGKKGTNHIPVFGLRYVDIPLMDFDILLADTEVLFEYRNGLIVDKLRKVADGVWLGQLFYKGKFVDWFWLVKK